MNVKTLRIWSSALILIICHEAQSQNSAQGLGFHSYHIRGYKSHTVKPGVRISVRAKDSSGLMNLGFEDLLDAEIEFETKDQKASLKADHILFKKTEAWAQGRAHLKLEKRGSEAPALEFKSDLPEDEIFLNLSTGEIKMPSGSISSKDFKKTGHSFMVDWSKGTVAFPTKNKGVITERLPSLH